MGHAMAETPAGAARALLYIVGTSPTFILHQSINHSYHTFHHRRRSQSVQKSPKSQSVRPNALDGLDGLLTTLN